MRQSLFIALMLALTGCAASYTQPTLPADHPAGPTAGEAPPPPRSRTLELTDGEPVAPAHAATDVGASGHKHDAPIREEDAVVYSCPMHPEVTSDKPDERCPKCGMKLKSVSETGEDRE